MPTLTNPAPKRSRDPGSGVPAKAWADTGKSRPTLAMLPRIPITTNFIRSFLSPPYGLRFNYARALPTGTLWPATVFFDGCLLRVARDAETRLHTAAVAFTF